MENLIQKYASADAAGRVGLIYSNFATFLGTVDSRTDGLVYLIENEKALSRRKANGDLGVFCNHFLQKVAEHFCRLLHLHFVGYCRPVFHCS